MGNTIPRSLRSLGMTVMFALTACDPCSGIVSCRTAPTVAADGQVIDFVTGKPVPNTTLEFDPAPGSALPASMRATSDALGQFHLSGTAVSEGDVSGTMTVRAPSFPGGYTSPTITLHASRTLGNGVDLGRVLAQPYFSFLGEVHLRQTGATVPATVHILRTGGTSLSQNDVTVQTDSGGRFFLQFAASGAADVIATVTVTVAAESQPFTFTNTGLPVLWLDQVPQVNRVFSLGMSLSLAYAIQAVHRGLDRGVPGVQFTWTRTGGIATTPTSLAGVSNEVGLFSLATTPSTDGTVIGDIVMTPPAPYAPQSFHGVQLQTFDTDEIRLYASPRFGQEALYAGELFRRSDGTLLPNVAVRFVPTGGVAAQPRTDTSNAVGRFLVAPYTDQIGQIVGDLVFNYLPPRQPEVVHGITLQTFEDDSLRFLQRWGVGPSLLYVGELRRSDTNAPIVGAQVTFKRTGGISSTPDPLVSTSIAGGRFGLNLTPSGDGTVEGNLSVHAPPLRDTTFAITLPTFNSDSVRLRAVWLINP